MSSESGRINIKNINATYDQSSSITVGSTIKVGRYVSAKKIKFLANRIQITVLHLTLLKYCLIKMSWITLLKKLTKKMYELKIYNKGVLRILTNFFLSLISHTDTVNIRKSYQYKKPLQLIEETFFLLATATKAAAKTRSANND